MAATPEKRAANASATGRFLQTSASAACVCAWILTVSVAIYYVLHFAQRFPYADDWLMTVPVLARAQSFNLAWLWSQYNEHRLFIPRLAFVVLGRIDHGDFRAPVLLNVAALAIVAALFLLAARRRRGGSSLSDCFFAFMLLHLLQSSVFWGAQFQFISSSALFCIATFVIVSSEPLQKAGLAVISVACALLPLCGANGLMLTPPLGAWLLIHGIYRLRRHDRAAGAIAIGGALAVTALSIGYLVGWHAVPRQWEEPTLASAGVVALQFATAGFGPDLALLWPAGGILVGVLLLVSVIVLVRAVAREGVAGRALPLLALVLALGLLCATVGWGRAGRGSWPLFFEYHYAPLALPLPCLMYFVSQSYWPYRAGVIARWLLLMLAAAVYLDSLPHGAHPHVAEMAAFEADLASGASAHDLVARHIHLLASGDTAEERATVERGLQGLFDAGYYRAR
jgi:hypothetical protein